MRADPASWPYNDPGSDDPDWTGGGDRPDWTAGDDSWPGGATGPNWTVGDDSWAGGGATPGWPYGEDHPSYPASNDRPGWPGNGGSGNDGPGVPGREPAPARNRNGRRAAGSAPARAARARVPASRGPDGMHGADGMHGPDGAQQWPGQEAAGTGPAAYYDAAAGDGRVQVLLPPANQDWQAGAGVGTGEMQQVTADGPAELFDPV